MLHGLLWLVQTPEGGWRPGLGDPTAAGYLTVAAYYLSAIVCYRASRGARLAAARAPGLARGWAVIAALMLVLGLIKQLDLLSWVTVALRARAHSHGWYAARNEVVWPYFALAGTLVAAAAATAMWLVSKRLPQLRVGAAAAMYLVAFVLARASSLHSIDVFLRSAPLGVRFNVLFELAGIACIVAAAASRRVPR